VGNVSETWHITLVHGTFARNAAWTRPGSALREHLETYLPGRVVYHRFRWSGWPSHFARDHAARDLRARLLKCVQNNETARHCVIAHSHGGNIVCYALRDAAELVERLDCIITLSTPFLLVRRRSLSLFGLLSALGSLYVAVFGLFLLGISWALGPSTADEFFDLLRHMAVNGWWSYKSWIAWLIGMSVAGLVWGAMTVIARWKAWLDATLEMPNLAGERLLVVRSFADEATALLVAAQFFEIVVTMFWGRGGALQRALLSSVTWFGKRLVEWSETPVGAALCRLVVAWWMLSLAGMVVLIPVTWYFYWTQPDVYVAFFLGPYTPTARMVWGSIALVGAPFVAGVAAVASLFLLLLVCGATIGVVVIMANICLALIMLVVVPELGPMAFVMAISAEPVPGAGIFRVLQIRPEHKIGMVDTRFHSTTYADPAALDAMADFIAQRLDAPESQRQNPLQ
jgi:hypothetical protein